jgi:hypothetical protein
MTSRRSVIGRTLVADFIVIALIVIGLVSGHGLLVFLGIIAVAVALGIRISIQIRYRKRR